MCRLAPRRPGPSGDRRGDERAARPHHRGISRHLTGGFCSPFCRKSPILDVTGAALALGAMTQDGPNHAINPWLMLAYKDLRRCWADKRAIAEFSAGGIRYELRHAGRSLWMI